MWNWAWDLLALPRPQCPCVREWGNSHSIPSSPSMDLDQENLPVLEFQARMKMSVRVYWCPPEGLKPSGRWKCSRDPLGLRLLHATERVPWDLSPGAAASYHGSLSFPSKPELQKYLWKSAKQSLVEPQETEAQSRDSGLYTQPAWRESWSGRIHTPMRGSQIIPMPVSFAGLD